MVRKEQTMPFLKCKKCVVKSCCSEICEDFKEYYKRKYEIDIGDGISLKQAQESFRKIKGSNAPKIYIWRLTRVGLGQTLFIHE
jgi:hypothetical protein